MEIWGATDMGAVRKQNQDCYRCAELPSGHHLAVVCDGMGGGKSGDVASSLAVETFLAGLEHMSQPYMEQADIVQMLVSAVRSTNQAVYAKSQSSEDYAGMGTTLVAVYMQGDDAYIVNVGDSRCYYLAHDEISQVTEDHSVVGLMVTRGQITEDEARHHPNKNLITRAVGTEPGVECDCFHLRLGTGESLLMCTDGLSNLVTRPEMLYEITHGRDGGEICRRMIAIANKRGAPDNVTAVLLQN